MSDTKSTETAVSASTLLTSPAKPKTRDLTQGPIASTLLIFALPILAGNVLQSLNGSVNAVWVGGHLGEAALTATANANNVMFALIGAVFGISMATNILIAQSIGAHNMAQAKRVLGSSATFFGVISILIALLGWPLSRHLMQLMSTPEAALPLAEAYLQVIFLAIPLLFMFSFVTAALRGAGDTKTPFWFLLLVVVLDMALNPLLIFGWGPVPRMGIQGSAMATLVANGVSFIALLGWLRLHRHPLWIGRRQLGLFKPDLAIVRSLIVKGLPMGVQLVMISLAMIAMISMVNEQGVQTASAYSAALQLWTYVQMPAMAIGAACSSMAAQNVGAKLWSRVDDTARAGMLINIVMTGGLIALILLLDQYVLSWFLPKGSASLEVARHLNHIAIGSFLFFGVTFVLSGVVRATGAVLMPMLILGIAMWGIRVPAARFLQPVLGVDALWWSFPISSAASVVMILAYYRWGNWRKSQMLPSAAPAAPARASLATTPAATQPEDAASVDCDKLLEQSPSCSRIAIPAEVAGMPPGPVANQVKGVDS
ncbi:MATE family efflux transporter [Comamonas sp. Y33R10-2]|uniref:MATE family efflux transporter n=1 Tax=Comamonas sp. Y33R10-2 TaxID=2853257 RepID=UPI001C5C8917|nr:MATE family efflux transporter [Comamonas sp. Y33R10-2]QXZ08996.1 MATE family efflux transporter [Comamonas sp. Y33R10-2]